MRDTNDVLDQVEARASNRRSRVSSTPIKIFGAAELAKLPPREYVVKHILDAGGVSLLVGETASFKTFAGLNIAMAVAQSVERWREHRVHGGRVIYFALEGAGSLMLRLRAYCQHNNIDIGVDGLGLDDAGIDIVRDTLDFRNEPVAAAIINAMNERGPYELVVIDTVSRALAGGDENSPEDMGALAKNATEIAKQTGAHVMLVHHLGKDKGKGARGHSCLRAAADTEIQVTRDGDVAELRVTMQRDHEAGQSFAFEAQKVDLGQDGDGDAVTSLVLVPSERRVLDAAAKKETGFSPQEEAVLGLLVKLAGQSPDGWVARRTWREATITCGSIQCQRRSKNASAGRSKIASDERAGRPPIGGLPAFGGQTSGL